ncbi:MAG: DUF6172 family protein [Pseudobdellovibrio sp.]
MKKNFTLTAPNKKPERQADSVKHEINKYIARERRKTIPAGVDFWDFDCKLGQDAETATVIHISEISKKIDAVILDKKETFYIEVLVKPGHRTSKKTE